MNDYRVSEASSIGVVQSNTNCVKSETEKEAETTPERDLIATTEMEPTITTLSRKGLKQTNKIEELVKNRHKEVTTKETNNSLVQKEENSMEISFGPDSRSLKES
ncbi:43688_t:CDS:2, partial [Gigaspora margarita]